MNYISVVHTCEHRHCHEPTIAQGIPGNSGYERAGTLQESCAMHLVMAFWLFKCKHGGVGIESRVGGMVWG